MIESKRVIKIFFIILFLLLGRPFFAQALIAPQVYFTEMKLSKNSFLPGEKIEGEVELWNYEDYLVNDLVFYFELLGEEREGVPTQTIDVQRDNTIFSLSAGEKTKRNFSYTLPQNLPKGTFKFRIQLANIRGEEMSWIDKVIEIGGEGKFLLLDNHWFIKNGQSLAPGGGLEYQPGEIPRVSFDVINNSNFTIVGFPKITTYKRNVGEEILYQESRENVIFTPKEKKTFSISLHPLTQPGTYLTEIRFYDPNDKEPISNSIYFRWVIPGEAGQILFVNPDKSSYKEGEEAKIITQFTGPAHEDIGREEEAKIVVKIFNPKGELIGKGEKKVSLRSGQETISVPIKEDVENPKISVEILKGEKILDQYESKVKPKAKEPEEKIKKVGFIEENKNLIVAFALIVLAAGAIVYYFLKIR